MREKGAGSQEQPVQREGAALSYSCAFAIQLLQSKSDSIDFLEIIQLLDSLYKIVAVSFGTIIIKIRLINTVKIDHQVDRLK